MGKRKRVIGTTREAIEAAERELATALPPSFAAWLLEYNGLGIPGVNVNIAPVFDRRDPRTTSNSIVRRNQDDWRSAYVACNEEALAQLLVFGDPDGSDLYCFDYARAGCDGEAPVVYVSHEGGTEDRAGSFAEFVQKLTRGEIED